MGAHVAELSGYAEEELVLFPQRLVDVAGQTGALFRLQRHVRVCDFGDAGEEEDEREEEDEGRDAEVGPLHGCEGVWVRRFEEHAGREQGRHDGADGLEGLREFEAEFGVARGTAGRDEGVRGRFERREARADDEQGPAEAAEGALQRRRPEHEGSDPVDAQACDEGPSVAEFADEESRVRGRADEVGAEVGALEAAGAGGGDVEGCLEFGVEDVQEAVGEAPEEEQDGHEGDGVEGLLDGEGRGAGDAFV